MVYYVLFVVLLAEHDYYVHCEVQKQREEDDLYDNWRGRAEEDKAETHKLKEEGHLLNSGLVSVHRADRDRKCERNHHLQNYLEHQKRVLQYLVQALF